MTCKHERLASVNGIVKCLTCGMIVPAPWETDKAPVEAPEQPAEQPEVKPKGNTRGKAKAPQKGK